MITNRINSAVATGRTPTSCGLSLLFACAVVIYTTTALADQKAQRGTGPASSPPAAETLAKRAFELAEAGKFGEVDLLLATLAESHATSDARIAAVLYASERAYAAGDRPRAAAWLKSLASAAPKRYQSAIAAALAWCEINPGDLKVPSARLLELADEHNATSFAVVALQLRAKTLVERKRQDEAIFVYHATLARFPKSRFVVGNMLAVARLHHDLGQDREAWEYLQRLVNEHPQASESDAALYLGVIVAQQLKHEITAREWLEQLVTDHEQSSYWVDAALRLAEQQVAAGQGDPKPLINKLAKKTTSGENSHRARFLLVRLAVAESDWKEVEQRSKELLSAKPSEPTKTLAQFWHAEAAYRGGERDVAFTRFLDLSLAIEGRQEDWLGVVPLRLAQIEAQRQRWSASLERADLLAKSHPNYSRMYEVDYLRGRSLAALARFDDARTALTKVIASDAAKGTESAAMAQWMIGEAYFQQQQYEPAIAAYERTLQHDFPSWKSAGLLQAAKCCEQLSRWNDAVQRYERVLREFGDTRYVAEARSRLATTQERAKVAAQTMTETTTR